MHNELEDLLLLFIYSPQPHTEKWTQALIELHKHASLEL